MNKTKTTQNETHKAAGNTPAAGASIGGNVPTADAEKETPTAEVPETEDAAEAQATAEVASAKTEIVPVLTMCKDVVIVVCGTPEALPLLTKAWKQKAAPAVILPREVGSAPFAELITGLLAEEEIHLIQEIMGYLLLPVNKAQKSFVFVGAPNAGKSTLLNVVQEILLGSENVSNIPWQNLGDRFNRAELFGKLANIFADLPSKSIDDNGMFKALTGEDFITAERKNKDPFSFRPYARFLFSCNEIPRNYGDRSEGFYRRLLIIRFEKSVPKAKRDPNLAEKLAAERDGILMWALTGLKRLIASGYVFSETECTRAELEKYRIESNSVLSFAKLYCVAEEEGVTVRDDLFLRYKEYCGNAGMKPVSQTNFNKELEAGFPEITRGRDKLSKRRIWRGITYCEGGVEAD